MKSNSIKSLLLALCCMFAVTGLQAQDNIVKVKPIGLFVQTSSTDAFLLLSKASYSAGVAFEHVLTDKFSAQLNLELVFGFGTIGVIKPELRYYILDQAPHGFYAGGYTDFGIGGIGAVGFHFALGGEGGYQMFFFDDRLAVDGNVQAGFGLLGGTGYSNPPSLGFHIYPSVAAGYAF